MISQQGRDLALPQCGTGDMGGGDELEGTAALAGRTHHQNHLGVAGQTEPVDVERPPPPGHGAVRLEDGCGAVERGHVVRTVQVEEVDELTLDVLDQRPCRRCTGERTGGLQDPVEIALLLTCPRLLTTAPQRQLGHRHADQQQQHRRHNVSGAVNPQLPIRLRQEHVEPDRAQDLRRSSRPHATRTRPQPTTTNTKTRARLVFATTSRAVDNSTHATNGNSPPTATSRRRATTTCTHKPIELRRSVPTARLDAILTTLDAKLTHPTSA